MIKSQFVTLMFFCALLTGCFNGPGDSTAKTSPAPSTGSENAPSGDSTASESFTYWKVDPNSTCENGVVRHMTFNRTTLTGTLTTVNCATDASVSENIDPSLVHFHPRFKYFLVYKGEILIEKEHFLRRHESPLFYCQLAEHEDESQLFLLALQADPDVEQCYIKDEYMDPFDFYFNGGGHGAPCTTFGLTESGGQVQFTDDDYDITINLLDGDNLNGFSGTVLLRASGGDVNYDLKCFAN